MRTLHQPRGWSGVGVHVPPDTSGPAFLLPEAYKEVEVTEEVPVYVPGETISFQLSFSHKMKVTEVEATFSYHGEGYTNWPMFRMVPDGGAILPSATNRVGDQRHTIIDMVSEEVVPAYASPGGEYRLTEVIVKSYLKKVYSLEEVPDIRCWVLSGEPSEPPTFEDLHWYP
jgi:hypothetical protein